MINKILIVDDSPISRRMLKSCIPKEPCYEFYEAGDGLAGFELFREVRPDVTFMDLTMPVMDGTESLQAIMQLDDKAVVIVCTADVQIKSIIKVTDLGAFHVIRKPPTKEGVQEALQKAANHLG